MEKKYRYLGYFLLALIPLAFAGFYKTYISQFPNFEENIDLFVHIHALIALSWMLILIIQPFLIFNKKYKFHRAVGRISYILFPLLILSFMPLIIKNIKAGNIDFIFFPLSDCILLIVFYTLAIYNRKTVSKHMRYMITTAIVLLDPTVGRIGPLLLKWSEFLTQHVVYGITYVLLISLILYDKANKKTYFPYQLAVLCYVIYQLVFYMIFA